MCGIFFSVSRDGFVPPSPDLLDLLSRRGPDCIREHRVRVACPGLAGNNVQSNASSYLSFTSSVLSVRGINVTEQPLIDKDSGSLLCWNGDAWKINGVPVVSNDTEAVFALLLRAATPWAARADSPCSPELAVNTSSTEESLRLNTLKALGAAIESISGPFAFIFYDALNQRVVFGRDCLGRRSLLQRRDDRGNLVISSVSDGCPRDNWSELDDKGVYWIDLAASGFHSHEAVASGASLESNRALVPPLYWPSKLPWTFTGSSPETAPKETHLRLPFPPLNIDLPHGPVWPLSPSSSSVLQLRQVLIESLALRIKDIPERVKPGNLPYPASLRPEMTGKPARVAILFSGGLDCTVLARLAHDILPSDQSIDLLNISFENPRVLEAFNTKQRNNAKSKKAKRLNTAPTQLNSIHRKPEDSIALSSVEDIQRERASNDIPNPYELCPDRITGRKSLAELRAVCHSRSWNFVEINIPYSETLEHRDRVISLIHPHNTEMDLSIAYAFYFAARGTGIIRSEKGGEPFIYTTSARILLSGLGADELFAGYSHHGAKFARDGFAGLLESMDLDIRRLGERNLGRDDRVISHHGKEARYPYLDEDLLNWALRAPVWVKTGFGQQDGVDKPGEELHLDPGKRILRLLAWSLGMEGVSKERKRAVRSPTSFELRTSLLMGEKIQFGARTAKMETGKTKGTSILSISETLGNPHSSPV